MRKTFSLWLSHIDHECHLHQTYKSNSLSCERPLDGRDPIPHKNSPNMMYEQSDALHRTDWYSLFKQVSVAINTLCANPPRPTP